MLLVGLAPKFDLDVTKVLLDFTKDEDVVVLLEHMSCVGR